MRNLITKFALVAALVTLVPAAAFASDARVQSLGLQGDYIQDYTNVYAYPSSIVRYQNLVYGNLGNKDVSGGDLPDFQDNAGSNALDNSGRSMGVYHTMQWLPGTWGIQINENRNAISQAYGPSSFDRNRNEGVTLLWGSKLGGGSVGFAVDKASSTVKSGTTTVSPYTWSPASLTISGNNARQVMNAVNASLGAEDRNSWGAAGGLSFNWNAYGREHTGDIAVHYRNNTLKVEDTSTQQLLEDNGNTDFSVNARVQMAVSDNSYLTPVFNWYTMDRGSKFTDGVTPANNTNYDNSVKGLQFGVAESWVMRESDLLVLGVSLNHESVDYADPGVAGDPFKVTYNTTPSVFGALEVHPASWFHVRMGAGKPVWSKLEIENKTTNVVATVKDSPIQYALGAGFRLGNRLDIDATLNQDFAFTGAWFGSGKSEVPFSNLSMTYRF
ncbi:MAG: hypothetical protein ABI960_02105 [Candidatus Eisenbacteria bacterium]